MSFVSYTCDKKIMSIYAVKRFNVCSKKNNLRLEVNSGVTLAACQPARGLLLNHFDSI